MIVLVTGATGFVGSHAVKALQDGGHTVRALIRTPGKLESVTARVGVDLDALETVQGDVTDAASVATAIEGCDGVVHAAAVVGTDPTTAAAIEATNLSGTENVLGAAVSAGCDPIVHISSSAALFPYTTDPVTADHPVGKGRDPYARTKAQCESVARGFQAAGMPVVIIYPAMVIGPDDYGASSQLEPLKLWLTKPFPRATDYSMSFVDVRDVAAVITAAMQPGRGSRRYLMFGHHLTSTEQHALLCEVTGLDLKSVSVPRPVFWAWGQLGDLARRIGKNLILTSEGYEYLFNSCAGDNSVTESETGVTLRPVGESLRDAITWLYQDGQIEADKVGVLAKS